MHKLADGSQNERRRHHHFEGAPKSHSARIRTSFSIDGSILGPLATLAEIKCRTMFDYQGYQIL